MRLVLPNCRPAMTIDADWDNIPITVTIGFDPATGAAREVFADTRKGGQIQSTLADSCVLISLALQHGIPASSLSKSLSLVPDVFAGGGAQKHGSPIGVIVDLLQGFE